MISDPRKKLNGLRKTATLLLLIGGALLTVLWIGLLFLWIPGHAAGWW
jgi:hypothetical protein